VWYNYTIICFEEVSVMNAEPSRGVILAQLRQLVATLRKDYNADYGVILYTAVGRIVCDLAPPAPKSELVGFDDDPDTIPLDISAEFDGTGYFETQLINVKDAVIYRSDSNEELERVDQMIVFVDQIIGFGLKKL
jgi:hypothetical protein